MTILWWSAFVGGVLAIGAVFFKRRYAFFVVKESEETKGRLSLPFGILDRLPMFLAASFVVVALFKPGLEREKTVGWQGRDTILLMDVSWSMVGPVKSPAVEYYGQPTRLYYAENFLKRFLENVKKMRHRQRISVLVFSDNVFAIWPLTDDFEYLEKRTKWLFERKEGGGQFNYPNLRSAGIMNGTQLGRAIVVAIEHLRNYSRGGLKSIFIVSDAINTDDIVDNGKPILDALRATSTKLALMQLNDEKTETVALVRASGGSVINIFSDEDVDRATKEALNILSDFAFEKNVEIKEKEYVPLTDLFLGIAVFVLVVFVVIRYFLILVTALREKRAFGEKGVK